MKTNRILLSAVLLICLLFAACDKDEIVRPPMEWTWEIITPESVKYEGGSVGWTPSFLFKANAMEGDVVLTCKNYSTLSFAETASDIYTCDSWATIRIEGNKLKIHFPQAPSGPSKVSKDITVLGRDGDFKALTVIGLTRTFDSGEEPEPEGVPDAAKFKMIKSDFTPFMHIDSPLPAPLDLITFRITDIDGGYSPLGFPEYTQYYDSIVWSAEEFPHTFRVYERDETNGVSEHFTSQWSSHFFRSGTIKTHLAGYSQGRVAYETSLDVQLYERDFLGLEWGTVVLQNPQNLTTYCLLDTDYEYMVKDIMAIGLDPFSKIIPVNNKSLSHSAFMAHARRAIVALMESNIGRGQNAAGKESLFKCLPEKKAEAELYWENKNTRMLMLHQIPDDPDELIQEKYYLLVEPK